MRYDTKVYFRKEVQGVYDKHTGNYTDQDPEELAVYANVTETSTENKQLIYGSVKQQSLTIRVQRAVPDGFNLVRIGDHVYMVGTSRRGLHGHAYIVSEVQ